MSVVTGLLNQTITTISSVVLDGYGAQTKTSVYTNMICRWEENFQTVLDKEGQEVIAKIEAWLPNTFNNDVVSIDINYIFLYNSIEYKVIAHNNHFNLLGEREYIKVFLK
jgi:hypothetical protein